MALSLQNLIYGRRWDIVSGSTWTRTTKGVALSLASVATQRVAKSLQTTPDIQDGVALPPGLHCLDEPSLCWWMAFNLMATKHALQLNEFTVLPSICVDVSRPNTHTHRRHLA